MTEPYAEMQCAEHCYLKRDLVALEEKVRKSAPLWSLILLIGLMVSTASYSFLEISKVRAELHTRITQSNTQVVDKLGQLSNTISEMRAKQEIILKHIQ